MRKVAVVLLSVLALAMCLAGCGTDDIDISEYADETIVITGIAEEDVVVTIADLKAMDCVTKTTESTSDKIGQVRATGPTLKTVLAQQGVDIANVAKIKFHGTDDYDYSLQQDYLAEHDVILAFGNNGEPLDAESAPCRIIIPNSDSAYWLRMLDRIDITLD